MTPDEIRDAIATEAARLILRRKVMEFHEARIRASRWMSKRKLSKDLMPSHAEIQAKIEALACLFEQSLVQESRSDEFDNEDSATSVDDADDSYHPDTFAFLEILLNRLDGLHLPTKQHPEGDALYHSLQVFELAAEDRPWDEEFQMAALVHDVGLAIDRRNPREATLKAIGPLLTERTCFLIEHLSDGIEYLQTGKVSKSLRRSDHFDDLVQLARFDLAGRVPGAQVRTVGEALESLAALETEWDEGFESEELDGDS